MATNIIVPIMKRKDSVVLVNEAFFVMGLMSIMYYKEFKNYFNLFMTYLKDHNKQEFKEIHMKSLFIFFDLIINNTIMPSDTDTT